MTSECANTHISVTYLDQNVSIILEQFDPENYILRLGMVQNLCELWQFLLSDFWAQNVSEPTDQNMAEGGKIPQ